MVCQPVEMPTGCSPVAPAKVDFGKQLMRRDPIGVFRGESVEHVVVLGMGGSGIAGDILIAAAAPFMAVPVVVVKSYELPHFVGEGSLVFVVSSNGPLSVFCRGERLDLS